MAKFYMLVGLPASGKSTLAKKIMDMPEHNNANTVYLSSDELREELFDDINNQDNNSLVFEQMRSRTLFALRNGVNVIYDATNLNRKKRKGLLQQLPKDVMKIAIYMATPISIIGLNNVKRERKVPTYVIGRMHKELQVPIYSEGWHLIRFNYHDEIVNDIFESDLDLKSNVLNNNLGYGIMLELRDRFYDFQQVYELSQDSKYHSFSVSRHIYYVYKHVFDNYNAKDEKDREIMLWTALLHDVGKGKCKSFKNRKGEETRYANFIGHEYVGSQIAINILKSLQFDDSFIHEVATLIQFHMYLLDENANQKKLLDYVGEERFKKLEFLRDADTMAH